MGLVSFLYSNGSRTKRGMATQRLAFQPPYLLAANFA
jgi:hypothetical protein